MGHDYNVPLRFLSITPTRDNEAAPGNRLADKHTRLFHGKTLDEWTMIQLWSSKYLGKAVFVCETEEHKAKLSEMAAKYDIKLMVRPRQMLHEVNDTGGMPISWAARQLLKTDYYSLITTPFVVSPCRPPGFFDLMVERYQKLFGNPDWNVGQMWVMGLHDVDGAMFEVDSDNYGNQLGAVYLNKNPKIRFGTTGHWMGWTHWWMNYWPIAAARLDLTVRPKVYDIPWWQDIHIDTMEQWEMAEYWFAKEILSLGEDCYDRYRASWSGTSISTAETVKI
jgi:hypothetical protein